MRRAVFGGSFDPPHNGHVNLVRQVREKAELDRVIVMPAGISPFKKDMERMPASGVHRYEMCRLAFADMPYVTVSDHEISQPQVSYTVNTVRHLRELYPEDELYLIVGGDMLLSFDRWRDYKEILSVCRLAAVSREKDGEDAGLLEKKAEALRKYGSVEVLPIDTLEISSTEIRKKIKKSFDISCYVPQNVVQYIIENALYR